MEVRIHDLGQGGLPRQGNLSPLPGAAGTFTALDNYQPLSAMPNPARSMVNFEYRLADEMEGASIVLFDLDGKQLTELPLPGWEGNIRWDTEALPGGIYFFQLRHDQGTERPQKLTITSW